MPAVEIPYREKGKPDVETRPPVADEYYERDLRHKILNPIRHEPVELLGRPDWRETAPEAADRPEDVLEVKHRVGELLKERFEKMGRPELLIEELGLQHFLRGLE
jgi:hypothetical protein